MLVEETPQNAEPAEGDGEEEEELSSLSVQMRLELRERGTLSLFVVNIYDHDIQLVVVFFSAFHSCEPRAARVRVSRRPCSVDNFHPTQFWKKTWKIDQVQFTTLER